ncbi:sugar kinase [Catellatospora sp. TT07R-123]|uniref:ROK family protein n=1 Tax=Catellatospora sp. TT07R-123 TaxID=2733863 RepID=UPI001B261378|nr:ROK family protein [Catellatospora sp. TT07R-123]GHJ46367.1 sugar kinase [Catellatospora sp. TT07R-123]
MTAPGRTRKKAATGGTDVVVSIDVGGTGIKCALVDAQHRVRHTERHATGAERGPQAVLETILDIAASLAATAHAQGWRPIAAGVVVPGIVDEQAGVARWSSNIGFRDVPLRDAVVERTGLPTAVGHDVRAGGMAEARLGAGRGRRHVLVVPIGTGIAAAHVVDGTVLSGAHGAAGEIGHIVVRPQGPACPCGLRGCLEAVASARAVQLRYTELTGTTATAAEVAARLGADPHADQVWAETVDALADGLLTGQALFDPELVIIGGGLAESGEALLAPLRESLAAKVTFHRLPEIVRAQLGDEAGSLGAALMALDLVGSAGHSKDPDAVDKRIEEKA